MVEVVFYNPEEHVEIHQEFLREVYPSPDYVMHSARFLRWQYKENPFRTSDEYSLKLVIHAGKVIGQLGIIPVSLITSNGSELTGSYPVNLIVSKSLSSLGFGALLMKDLVRSYDFVLNSGSSVDGYKICEGLGMRDHGVLRRYVNVTDPKKAQNYFSGEKIPEYLLRDTELSAFDANVLDSDTLPDAIPIACPEGNDIAVQRNMSYLRWRYQEHPAFAYRFVSCGQQALMVYRYEEVAGEAGGTVCRVVDFLGDYEVFPALFRTLTKQARRKNVVLIDFYSSLGLSDSIVSATGLCEEGAGEQGRFASLFQPLDFRKSVIRVLVGGNSPLVATANIYVTKGDSDQDRPNSAASVGKAK